MYLSGVFLAVSGVQVQESNLNNMTVDSSTSVTRLSRHKEKVGLTLTKSVSFRITLNLDLI